jgi:uncharacterized repeat protein (TIGR03803 family)
LFGTTEIGGTYNKGVVYEFTVDGSLWNQTVIHSFKTATLPFNIAIDAAGNLYGSARSGGKYGTDDKGGIIYKLAHDTWKETVLHNFCAQANCADGSGPFGPIVRDSSGNIFGTTLWGGATGNDCSIPDYGCGVAFERSADGTYHVLHNFCALPACADGSLPDGLIRGLNGEFLGLAEYGGANNDSGAVFSLKKVGGSWTEAVLYNFCGGTCLDHDPEGPLLLDGSGNLFVETIFGGSHDDGAVFKLTP